MATEPATFAPTTPSPPSEIATIIVRGVKFEDWETVWVQHRWADDCAHFRFTAAERDPIPNLWTRLQFKPGDTCQILLGGYEALLGYVNTRQVAYNANQHQVQIIGKSPTSWAYKSSVDTDDGNFDNMDFVSIATKVLGKYAQNIVVVGTPDSTKFEKLQVNPGETTWDFLERLARIKGIVLGSDHLGNALIIGQHSEQIIDNLVEGQNIKQLQCIIHIEDKFINYDMTSQKDGSDDQSGSQVSEMRARANGNTASRLSTLITPSEHPGTYQELQKRAQYEARWHEGTIIQATVTVQGWFQGGGGLWRCGKNVVVSSPMAMLNMLMKIQNVTFTQDSQNGTQTTLDLVVPWLLGDQSAKLNASDPDEPGAAKIVTSPAPKPVPKVDPGQGGGGGGGF